MKKVLIALISAIFWFSMPVFGQNAAVLVSGNFSQSFKMFVKKTDLTAKQELAPGAEFIIKPRSRVSFGVGFKKLEFNKINYTTIVIQDEFSYTDNGQFVIVSMPGTVFASYDRSHNGSANAVLGTVYFNFTKEKPVQPFVGVGGGVGFFKEESESSLYLHPLFLEKMEKTGFVPQSLGGTAQSIVPIITGKVGVNIYPAKHVIIRVAGGYLNGGFAEFGAGLVF